MNYKQRAKTVGLPLDGSVHLSYKEFEVWMSLSHKYCGKTTIRDIANEYKTITYGDIGRILKGKFPKSCAKREELGLPALGLAPICPKHGVPHAGVCPDGPYKVIRKRTPAAPRHNWRADLAAVITDRLGGITGYDPEYREMEY